jgi:hypothetical protein
MNRFTYNVTTPYLEGMIEDSRLLTCGLQQGRLCSIRLSLPNKYYNLFTGRVHSASRGQDCSQSHHQHLATIRELIAIYELQRPL